MNMARITCPGCASVGQMSLLDQYYKGPYRCWKCRGNYLIVMEYNELRECSPMSDEEFDRYVAEKAARDK